MPSVVYSSEKNILSDQSPTASRSITSKLLKCQYLLSFTKVLDTLYLFAEVSSELNLMVSLCRSADVPWPLALEATAPGNETFPIYDMTGERVGEVTAHCATLHSQGEPMSSP